MQRTLPASYRAFIEGRHVLVHHDGPRLAISARGFWGGGFLSLLLAGGAPYVTMAMRATPLACNVAIVTSLILNFSLKLFEIELPHGFHGGAFSLLVSLTLFFVVSLLSPPKLIASDVEAIMDL